MQPLIRLGEESRLLDSIIKEDSEIKAAIKKIESNNINVVASLIILAENLTVTAMSSEEIKKNLKLLEDPEIAKEVADALKRSMSGEEIKIAKLPAGVGPVLLALMAFLGPVFAQDAALKKDFADHLTLKKVELPAINEFKENVDDTKELIDVLNDVIKAKEGRDISGFATITIGGKKLTAKNKHEAEVMQHMVKIDNKMRANVALGFMSKSTYTSKVDKMIKAFETGRPIVM